MTGARTFHVLIVDDNPATAYLLKAALSRLSSRPELHFADDGAAALAFLHRRENHAGAVRPDLILLDMDMPKLSGLDVLSAIKSHPELRVIPVVMLSASSDASDVQRSYREYANACVEKPASFERLLGLAQAIEAFWMSSVVPGQGSRASLQARTIEGSRCAEQAALADDLEQAVRELLEIHQQELNAFTAGDSEFHRFDILSHMANDKRQQAKYAYLRHVEEHGCADRSTGVRHETNSI